MFQASSYRPTNGYDPDPISRVPIRGSAIMFQSGPMQLRTVLCRDLVERASPITA